jgi:NAD(P)-dependent dehydrogenase (short-subunit alcohol dehydrogenase family)
VNATEAVVSDDARFFIFSYNGRDFLLDPEGMDSESIELMCGRGTRMSAVGVAFRVFQKRAAAWKGSGRSWLLYFVHGAEISMTFEDSFRGKVAIVTGGASGIGKALGGALSRSRATVTLIDKDEEALLATVKELGNAVEGKTADVTDFESVKRVVDEVFAKYGKLDHLFNNAGTIIIGEVRDISIEDWREVIGVNLMGVVNGVAAAYPEMVRQKSGHIVNVASMVGLMPVGMQAAYTASKFGVVGLSHALRVEGRQLGVKVSVVCPPCVDTPMWTKAKVVGSTVKTPNGFVDLSPWWPKFLDADTEAEIILKGVMKNKATIKHDLAWQLMWWLYRLFPRVYLWVEDITVMKQARAVREKARDAGPGAGEAVQGVEGVGVPAGEFVKEIAVALDDQ